MPKKTKTLRELEKLAKSYGVQENALFKSAIEQYKIQLDVLKRIKSGIAKKLQGKQFVAHYKKSMSKGREKYFDKSSC